MPPLLEVAEFLPADLPLVADFHCGDTTWGRAMSNWIRAPQTAKFGNARHDTTIWLYYNPDDRMVGFGSIGTTRRPHPSPDDSYENFSIIPALAVHSDFQHIVPESPTDNPRYSNQILSHLINEAMLLPHDFLVLHVHSDNTPALNLYRHYGFKEIQGSERRDDYINMQRR
ncbi:MAG: hypothetical protein K8R46_11360, partial [Pirellulales bacterium]|nr:hypothetical protein [Pirellulales bacterium]